MTTWHRNTYEAPGYRDLWLALPDGTVVVGFRVGQETWHNNIPGENDPVAMPVAWAEMVPPVHPDAEVPRG